MRTDLENVSAGTEFQSDVCILGAGVAGLVLASKLAAAGRTVHLLEAGGETLEPRSQNLYNAEMRGAVHQGTTEGRFRTLGGSSTRWAGQLLPYPPEVFQKRDATGGIGWPISESDIARYYPDIVPIMGVNDLPFTQDFVSSIGESQPCGTPEVDLRFSKWSPISRRNLGRTLGKDCFASGRVTLFLHANATLIDLHPDGNRVESIRVKNYQGANFTFKATTFVVSCGTIETSRILLASNNVHPAGIGNAHDLVGRYFHDHVTAYAARVMKEDLPIFLKLFAPHYVKNTLHTPRLEASAALQQSLNILGVMAGFYMHEPDDCGFPVLRRTVHNFHKGWLFSDPENLRSIPGALRDVLGIAWHLKVGGRRFPAPRGWVDLRLDFEQKPRSDSRILLGERPDAIGMRRAVVDWKFSREDGETPWRYTQVIRRYLESFGMSSLKWDQANLDGPDNWINIGHDVFHPMGGARMGDDPRTSVADRDLKVHGIANLHLASCAVYPTGGSSNPTFTLMALSLRLADHLLKP